MELVWLVSMKQMDCWQRFSLLAMAAALLISGCSETKSEISPVASATSPATDPLPKPEAKPGAEPEAKDDGLTITGPLIVEHQVDITAQRDGIVANISADSGARVGAGEILARLDNRQLM